MPQDSRVDLTDLEQYYDTVPRRFTTTEEVGPFTLFLDASAGWPWYARPRLGGPGPYDAAAVAALLARMRELGVPETIEWTHDLAPGLVDAVRAEGSLDAIEELPLMVLRGDPSPGEPPVGVTVRMLGPDDEDLLVSTSGVARLAFAPPRDQPAGATDRDAAGRPPSPSALELLRNGEARIAVAEDPDRGVLATGRHIPVGTVSEVVGVATLPAEQGRGLASAVTRALVADAAEHGVRTLFLTAGDERVARIYGRLGFRRVGTGYVAERDSGPI